MLNDTETPRVDADEMSWPDNAPKGGKTVMKRILKEGANVPLFFAQTLISSLRDQGYNDTTSALCEHIDNAIEAGATKIGVYFHQTGRKGDYTIDTLVYDNGPGMAPNVLKVAMSFGGSLHYNNREGIGRFGMGMKTAALSMSPVLELFSWQERDAFYNATLDVDAIGRERSNSVEMSDPTLLDRLPDEVVGILTKPLTYPRDAQSQNLLAKNEKELREVLGDSGTIVFMPECDRLSYAKAQTLAEHATRELARVYRRQLANGINLFVNNRSIDAFDPTYAMESARHVRFLEGIEPKKSRLITAKKVPVPIGGPDATENANIMVKLYKLPIEDWYHLPRKVLKNDLQVFNGQTVSILRNDRELLVDRMPDLTTRHAVTHWFRVQIDFPGVLDEAFGVSANKQGVRLKDYVKKAIKDAIGEEISRVADEVKRFQSAQQTRNKGKTPSTSEQRATDADAHQIKSLDLGEDEEREMEENWRALAVTLKRDDETDEEAFERIKASKYIIDFKHDEHWPFYLTEHKFGRLILTLNTAHPFFSELYEPLRKGVFSISEDEDDSDGKGLPEETSGPVVALELMLLSLARVEASLGRNDSDTKETMKTLRREWSETLRIQLAR